MRSEQVANTWIVPETRDDLGVRVSTIRFGPEYQDFFETMVVGGPLDGASIGRVSRSKALEDHKYWVSVLTDPHFLATLDDISSTHGDETGIDS